MGPRGFWIALAIVLFYLIARPHIGTVWYVVVPPSPPPPSDLPSGAEPFVADTPRPQRFLEKRDCYYALTGFAATGAYCVSGNALLWGW